MKNIDLLFQEHAGKVSEDYLADMGLEHINNILEPEPCASFLSVISAPIKNREKILERQNILKDFLEYPGLAHNIRKICVEIQQNKCVSTHQDKRDRLKDFRIVLERSMHASSELLKHLKHREFSSQTLKDLRGQLEDCDAQAANIRERMSELINASVNNHFTLDIKYGSGFKFSSANIYSNQANQANETQSNSNAGKINILKLLKKANINIKKDPDGFYYGAPPGAPYSVIGEQIKDIINKTPGYVGMIIYDLNRHILNFCASLAKQLNFYIACTEIIKYLEGKNISMVFPEFCGEITAENLLDFGLILNGSENIVANDFADLGGAYYFISGENQGGKTTFLKSLGIAQLFAQSGMIVPAAKYICPVFNNFVSHFPKDEDEDLNFGKLAEELTRIRQSAQLIADNSLALFNESFATTTESEGFEIARDILRAFSRTSAKILLVTHNLPLLKKREELNLPNNIKIRSLIVDGRTYKIIEGEPRENLDTIDFLERLKRA